MNIVIDIRNLSQKQKTGIGEYTFEFLNHCFSVDKENNYFLFFNNFKKNNELKKNWQQKNVHFVFSRWPNKILNFCLFFKIIKLDKFIYRKIKNKNIKIDYFFLPNINFINFSKNIKYILTIHDLSFVFMPYFFCLKRRLWHKILNPKKKCQRAYKIICPSENTKQDLVEVYKIKAEKILVNYLGIAQDFENSFKKDNLEKIKKKYGLPENFILFLGTIEPRKNISSLIDAFIKGNFYKKGYSLILAGCLGWKNKKIFQEIKNASGVKYIAYVDSQDKKNLYNLAKIFVYPSFYEGFGLPVLEAMRSKSAIVTSNNSSLPELVNDSAFLVNPNNIDEIKNAMQFFLENPDFRKKIGEKAFLRSKDFSYKKHVESFLEFIQK